MEPSVQTQALQQLVLIQPLEALRNYNNHGILNQVTRENRERDLAGGAAKAASFGFTRPEDILEFDLNVIDCAKWSIQKKTSETIAITKHCKLCNMAKDQELPSPCALFCINPVRGIVEGVEGNYRLDVEETLWNGDCCRFKISKKQ